MKIDADLVRIACGGRAQLPDGEWAAKRVEIDSRKVGPGDLFFGLTGVNVDGGRFAADALAAGAAGVVVGPGWYEDLAAGSAAAVFETADPLTALQELARAWRRRLNAKVIAITGSDGSPVDDSTQSANAALYLDQHLRQVIAMIEENGKRLLHTLNSLLDLAKLRQVPNWRGSEAFDRTERLVLEMGMRGPGQIAELAAIAEPDVGVITNAGPVHTELLGSVAAVAAAKAELLGGLADGSFAVVPAEAGALAPELIAHEGRLRLLRFGTGGEIEAIKVETGPGGIRATIRVAASEEPATQFAFPFTEHHNLLNSLAAIGAGFAAGASLAAMSARAGSISFSRFRGERIRLADNIILVNDCYNANPLSMKAALTHLGQSEAGRRVAVLGLMAELGPEAEHLHREIGEAARQAGVDQLVGVGAEARWYAPDELVATPEEAAELLAGSLGPGDLVLVKGSRSAGLEVLAESLAPLLRSSEEGRQAAPGREAGGQSISDASGPRWSRGGRA